LTTFFLNLKSRGSEVSHGDRTVDTTGSMHHLAPNALNISTEKVSRLIEWNVQVMTELLKQIVARRKAAAAVSQSSFAKHTSIHGSEKQKMLPTEDGKMTIDEVREIIELPKFKASVLEKQQDPQTIELSAAVTSQLHSFVSRIAASYRQNPFHSFEHASHVSMSVRKLLSRIVAPSEYQENLTGKNMHDHTYGITSDPLTQFSCVFSALIHDVDHLGIPNSQIVKEQLPLAGVYKNQSVAEQNSVDLSWTLLQDPEYTDLRKAIYRTESEYKRFRQLVVNGVMATDIVDKKLKELRNARWSKAFKETPEEQSPQEAVNRKATIVIEHLIQASDVSHTMQHWHIYRKWNERFFLECYKAYYEGRAENDPSGGWYKGEMGFFDFYIIPLAKKLKDCGVFGVSSDEYLIYAQKNRQEWELRGQEVVAEMIQLAHQKIGVKDQPVQTDETHPIDE